MRARRPTCAPHAWNPASPTHGGCGPRPTKIGDRQAVSTNASATGTSARKALASTEWGRASARAPGRLRPRAGAPRHRARCARGVTLDALVSHPHVGPEEPAAESTRARPAACAHTHGTDLEPWLTSRRPP